ncbi:hypothetical protein [Nocardia altamirensis]|uniref:hypothetical protein n=1 Tax=Nocardia altamirensis TaxID=472158 RepID=UPI00114CAB8F|nr:hypothetical protein [Nocardia altamirensis]
MHTLAAKDEEIGTNVAATETWDRTPTGAFDKPRSPIYEATPPSKPVRDIDVSDWKDKVTYPRFDDSGRMFDQNNTPFTGGANGWADFLMDGDGEFITGNSYHGILYKLQRSRDGSAAFGIWRVQDGWLGEVNPVCNTYLEESLDPKFPAQLRDRLINRNVDLTKVKFDTESQGKLWKGEAPVLSVERMRTDAESVFKGYGDDFWVDVTKVSRHPDQVDVALSLNPVRGEPGQVTVAVQRVDGLTTVRFTDFEMGPERTRTLAVLHELRETMTPWIAESGAIWHPGA